MGNRRRSCVIISFLQIDLRRGRRITIRLGVMSERAVVPILAITIRIRTAKFSWFSAHHDATADNTPADGIKTVLLLFFYGR
jgi:hypothetical protein